MKKTYYYTSNNGNLQNQTDMQVAIKIIQEKPNVNQELLNKYLENGRPGAVFTFEDVYIVRVAEPK